MVITTDGLRSRKMLADSGPVITQFITLYGIITWRLSAVFWCATYSLPVLPSDTDYQCYIINLLTLGIFSFPALNIMTYNIF